MKRTHTLAGLAVTGAVAAALAVPQLAGAEEASPGGASEDSSEIRPGGDGAEAGPERGQDELASRLALELDLRAEEVSVALETVLAELRSEHQLEHLEHLSTRLDEAVESGRLSREQADAILAAAREGALGALGGHRGPGGPGVVVVAGDL